MFGIIWYFFISRIGPIFLRLCIYRWHKCVLKTGKGQQLFAAIVVGMFNLHDKIKKLLKQSDIVIVTSVIGTYLNKCDQSCDDRFVIGRTLAGGY